MSDTKQRLLDGALTAIARHGIAGVSARTIAAAAGVNQALVFYHFGSVDELLAAACVAATEGRVAQYADRLDRVGSLRDLLDLGRVLHAEEKQLGHVSVLAQLLAGAQHDPKLAAATGTALQRWIDQIESTLHRLLTNSPVAEICDVPGLARAVCAGFVGLELYEGVDEAGAQRALGALEQLALLVEIVDELGPVSRRALQSKIKRAAVRRVASGH